MNRTPGRWRIIPTSRRTSKDMVDIISDVPNGTGTYSIANYVRRENGEAIVEAVNRHGDLLFACRHIYDVIRYSASVDESDKRVLRMALQKGGEP